MSTNETIRIIAAVVDVTQLTMYKENGETIVIPQGDARLRRILEVATPQLVDHNYADITLEVDEQNQFVKFERESSGLVKFFRIAKDKIKHLFVGETETKEPVPAQVIGQVPMAMTTTQVIISNGAVNTVTSVPSSTTAQDHLVTAGIYDVSEEDEVKAAMEQAEDPTARSTVRQTMNAINEIMQHAIPVTSTQYHEQGVAMQGNVAEENGKTDSQKDETQREADNPDTIIAVVDNKVIPGMERIKTQFARAAKLGSTQGMENFLKRLAVVIEARSHSVQDLLKFLERGDLPIADDGSILIYKVLKRNGNSKTEYVDCHTCKVEQFVGAFVCMDVKLVDPNRRNECSNGLHVARRGYISQFSGDVCVLAKLAPEDVIAVPEYDANKMRVCGYHIIMELSREQYAQLRQNKPMTDLESGRELLANAMAGKHVTRTHEVRITQQNGGGVITTVLEPVKTPVLLFKTEPETTPINFNQATALDNPAKEAMDVPADPKEVVQQVEQVSRKAQAAKLHETLEVARHFGKAADIEAATLALVTFKKEAKISWEKLGVPDPTASTSAKAKPAATVTPVKPKVKTVPTVAPVAKAGSVTEGSPKDRIQKLLAIGIHSAGVAKSILTIKKQSKKSWDYLGVPAAMVVIIQRLAGE